MSKTPLTAKAVEAAQPTGKQYKITDPSTPGLYVLVHPNGSKYWRFRYWYSGRERLQALGVYPVISLKEARKKAAESRLLIARGDDPIEVARKERQLNDLNAAASFKAMANEWYQTKNSSWSEGYARQVRAALDKDVFPVIGKQSVTDITPRGVLAILKKKEKRSPEQARKIRQWIGEVFKHAIILGLINNNPAANLAGAMKPRRPGHNAWIPLEQIPAFFEALQIVGSVKIKTFFHLLILTALRTQELRLCRWKWINLDDATITLPAEVMKARRPHIVPLPRQAVELLRDQYTRSGHFEYVFPGRFTDGPLSPSATLKTIDRIGWKGRVTGHGFRTTFSTALNNSGRYSPDWIEMALAHVPGGIRGTYNQALYLKQRREMLQDYADAVDAVLEGRPSPLEP